MPDERDLAAQLMRRPAAPTPDPRPQSLIDQLIAAAQQAAPPAPLRGLRTLFEGGVDVVSGALGVGPESKANLVGQMLSAGVPMAAGVKKGIKAFHGSPHAFDKFSMEKIGTGEGAQAYGHGLYFAENEGVARSYRDALGSVATTPSYPNLRKAMDEAADANIAAFKTPSPETQAAARAAQARVQELQKAVASEPKGAMYEVNINADPDTFLDWDAPLAKQRQDTLAKVRQVVDTRYGTGTTDTMTANGADPKDLVKNFDDLPTGDMEKMLRQEGIPGIKYLDGGSRTAGEGSRNYVVFDASIVDLVKKYGLVGAIMASLGMNPTEKQER